MPVSKQSLLRYKNGEGIKKELYGSYNSSSVFNNKGEEIYIEFDVQWPADDFMSRYIDQFQELDQAVFVDSTLLQLVQDGTKQYLTGKIGMEEAVSKISNTLKLHMAE